MPGTPPAVDIKIGSYTGSRLSRDIGALVRSPRPAGWWQTVRSSLRIGLIQVQESTATQRKAHA